MARDRHLAFARSHFGGCCAHAKEAADVHRVIERLWQGQVNVTPDLAFAEIFDQVPPGPAGDDSLDRVEYLMMLEEEIGAELPGQADGTSWVSAICRALLGRAAAARNTWGAETLRSRSVRGIINERVRLRGDCSCGRTAA